MNRVSNPLGLAAIVLLFLGAVLVNNVMFDNVRVDLTENNVYSISDGTRQLLSKIDEPVNLYFFFSNKNSEGIPQLRNYAARVQSILEEYERAGNGMINLTVINPESFSEEEDRATELGLTAASVGMMGDTVYFGLAGSNSVDDTRIIPFFDPQQEAILEYDISRMIYQLANPKPIRVTMITSLQMEGGYNSMQGRVDPPWALFQQLNQLYEVTKVLPSEREFPAETDVLLLLHPKSMTEELYYAVDQYALNGGKVVAFVDPFAESAMRSMGGGVRVSSSELNKLLSTWGVAFDPSQVVLDAQNGIDVRLPEGGVGRHMGYIGLTRENIDLDDVVTAGFESINTASMGAIQPTTNATTRFMPILYSSPHASLVSTSDYLSKSRQPTELAKLFVDKGESLVLGARVTGKAFSAYEEAIEGMDAAAHKTETDDLQLIVVTDSDMFVDRFWINQQSFYGNVMVQPFADNGDLVTNAIENLGGSSELVDIRGRGQYTRPFDVVRDLTVQAEAKFRDKEQELKARLEQTEKKLKELQGSAGTGANLVLSPEQEKLVENFMSERVAIRKQLREVQHQLSKDIESLGSVLKFINIALTPILLTLILVFIARIYRRKQII